MGKAGGCNQENDGKLKLSFEEARSLFIKYGSCDHQEEFHECVEPHNCGVRLVTCKVCRQELKREYIPVN